MNASDLRPEARRDLVARVRTHLGSDAYDRLSAALGEDALLDQVLSTAKAAVAAETERKKKAEKRSESLMFGLLVLILVGGWIGVTYGAGGPVGVISGIVAGGLLGAWWGPGQFNGGPVSMVLGGIGGVVGGAIAGAQTEKSEAWMMLVIVGALAGVVIELVGGWLQKIATPYR